MERRATTVESKSSQDYCTSVIDQLTVRRPRTLLNISLATNCVLLTSKFWLLHNMVQTCFGWRN